MPRFDIEMTRVGYGVATITVEAADQAEAERKALEEAGDHLYSEKTSEYELANGPSPAARSLESASVDELLGALRARGAVVCAWTPQDLVECERASNEQAAAAVLQSSQERLQEQMCEAGWRVIDAAIDRAARQAPRG